ncbi:chromosome segregation protein [Capnocytophaga ochracea]|uniref:Chromosome segregation protein n=2 Tax=Capnocytophaga TaxID=1016 RepID=A0A7Z8YCQ8_CAPOC|nr:AAA family ATPase [Capnocytophaga ochracea]EIW94150.1 AAA domain protein [Capnocytophaga sp. oral taxon 412 str. F0487]VDG81193.1 chromosome segregation protein [Capnocytophaga ochracea]
MSRQIYLPELLSINIKNYTLYPNGLDYTFEFVKGANLVLGGNGMGKTTFVNIIRFAILGLYKKPFGYTRTYQGNIIEKRQLFPQKYFSSRMDDSVRTDTSPTVSISMKINNIRVELTRDLSSITLTKLKVDGIEVLGNLIDQVNYEKLSDIEKKDTLPYKYENIIKTNTNLEFDDLIFFVNEVLFFGEDHKTILWNDEGFFPDVQSELFNKYFNDPDLDKKRQEAIRKAKYFDSLSRHISEDIRAINKVLSKMKEAPVTDHSTNKENIAFTLIDLKAELARMNTKLETIQKERVSKSQYISLLQNDINKISLSVNDKDKQLTQIEEELNSHIWETVHPLYHIFIKNIQLNHVCPMCSHPNGELVERVTNEQNNCFVCGTPISTNTDTDIILRKQFEEISVERKSLYQSINSKKQKIQNIEQEIINLDSEFSNIESRKREIQQNIRELEYENVMSDNSQNSIQPFLDEVNSLTQQKEYYQKQRDEQYDIVTSISNEIEDIITANVQAFSSIFSQYAGKFLGVPCELTYMKQVGDSNKRFYPIIDGKVRFYEEEMSESQRFFVDHSFRMSILTFFYKTPSFYIVETPDSSLDISYEGNAASVFAEFLKKPNSLIITSNLNNSLFIEHLLNQKDIDLGIVGLLEIAKQSTIQNTNEQLKLIYQNIKKRLKSC